LKKTFFKLFQHYLFNTKRKIFNTITFLHFSEILFMEHNAKKHDLQTFISGKEHSLNKQMTKFGISMLFQYLMHILAKFNTFSSSENRFHNSILFQYFQYRVVPCKNVSHDRNFAKIIEIDVRFLRGEDSAKHQIYKVFLAFERSNVPSQNT